MRYPRRSTYDQLPSFRTEEEGSQDDNNRENPVTGGQSIPMTDLGGSKDRCPNRLAGPTKTSENETLFASSHRVPGWRAGAAIAVLTAGVALIINISVGAWALNNRRRRSGALLVELFQGDCKKVANTNTWVHLAINALSTGMLSGSNYCMQCLIAPTRDDINRAHKDQRWLDIGVPSVRNLGSIGPAEQYFGGRWRYLQSHCIWCKH